jgi:short-subunit dehydrogenase
MSNPVRGKHVLITGAGRGLGAAYAVIFSEMGAKVIIAGRDASRLKSVAEAIRMRSGKAPETVQLDLSEISEVSAFAQSWCAAGRPLDILLNNAATWLAGGLDSHSADQIAGTIVANVAGTLVLTRGLLPALRQSAAADIVNVVAISGMTHVPLQTASIAMVASKYGQAGMTDGLRQELRGQNVRVTALYPPYIKDISPLDPEEWDAPRDGVSWVTNRDMVDATLAALSRARHVSFQSVMLESDTSNFHFHVR